MASSFLGRLLSAKKPAHNRETPRHQSIDGEENADDVETAVKRRVEDVEASESAEDDSGDVFEKPAVVKRKYTSKRRKHNAMPTRQLSKTARKADSTPRHSPASHSTEIRDESDTAKAQENISPEPRTDEDEAGDEYPVRGIIDERNVRGERQYLVVWAGKDPATGTIYKPTWEPQKYVNEAALEEWLETVDSDEWDIKGVLEERESQYLVEWADAKGSEPTWVDTDAVNAKAWLAWERKKEAAEKRLINKTRSRAGRKRKRK